LYQFGWDIRTSEWRIRCGFQVLTGVGAQLYCRDVGRRVASTRSPSRLRFHSEQNRKKAESDPVNDSPNRLQLEKPHLPEVYH
jgi:hypothetical protein